MWLGEQKNTTSPHSCEISVAQYKIIALENYVAYLIKFEINFVHISNYGDYPYHVSNTHIFIAFILKGIMK
jgi:hypothetical protein